MSKLKVLVIEDDPDVLETINSVLENFFDNTEMTHIPDGSKFKTGLWQKDNWSLVVLDLMMPGMTGFEVCETLRRFPKTRKVPILALTGYDTLQNEERIKKAGATGYMAKPFEIQKFLEEVKRLLKV